jgi:hypothetical protein
MLPSSHCRDVAWAKTEALRRSDIDAAHRAMTSLSLENMINFLVAVI